MPIEFFCPGCGKQMRTPDDTGGRKGRCPNCQTKVLIPETSVLANGLQPVSSDSPSQGTSDTISLTCHNCGRSLQVPTANAGKKGQCPQCATVMSIPTQPEATAAARSAARSNAQRWKGAPEPAASPQPALPKPAVPQTSPAQKIEFRCAHCQKLVRVASSAAGQMGRCPQCQAVVKIPAGSTVTPGLTPLPLASSESGLTPLPSPANTGSVGGLTPLPPEPSGLTPLPSSGSIAGLTPIGDSASTTGLTPLPAETNLGAAGGLTPLSNDPFAAGSTPFPSSPSYVASAPYAAPSSPGATAARRKTPRSGMHTATMVCAVLLIIFAVGQLTFTTIGVALRSAAIIERDVARFPDMAGLYTAGFWIGMGLVYVKFLTVIAGAVQMARFQTWGLCLTACILTLIPCNCFWVVGLPLGIWGLVMLNQSPVRSAFS